MQPITNQDIEARIIKRLVGEILDHGHRISVWEGEAFAIRRSASRPAIIAAMRSTGEDVLHVVDAGGRRVGWVHLVYGNGPDVIADCSGGAALTVLLVSAEAEAERARAAV